MKTVSLVPAELSRERDMRLVVASGFAVAAVYPLLPVHPPLACPLRSLTGIPCPLCGMTRACVAAVHGHIAQSLAFNPAGILLLALSMVVLVRPSMVRGIRLPMWTVFVAVGALWLWNIGFNPTFHQLLLR